MASAWAEEAERQARELSRELGGGGAELTYQKREARFVLRGGPDGRAHYFSAHDYEGRTGRMDWRRLRADVLARVQGEGAAGTV